MLFRIVLGHETVDHDRLRRALLADQQHRLLLLCDRLDEKVGSHVVDVRDENGRIFGSDIGRVVVLVDVAVPVNPTAYVTNRYR